MRFTIVAVLVAVIFVITFVFIAVEAKSRNSGSIPAESNIDKYSGDISRSTDRPKKDLHGASIVWSDFGSDIVDAKGNSAITNLLIDGAKDVDIDFHVIVRAKIGPFSKVLIDEIVTVSKNDQMVIPVNVGSATNLHEKQLEYVTRISGLAVAKSPIEEIKGAVIRFEERYLAFNEQGKYFEAMDRSVKENDYPLGFTTQEGNALAANILNASKEEGVFIEAVGSGAYKSWWMTEEEKAASD